jgi:hypothetical protein
MSGRKPAKDVPEGPGETPDRRTPPGRHPPPEDQFGGGDICSPEETPSTDDDKPLD